MFNFKKIFKDYEFYKVGYEKLYGQMLDDKDKTPLDLTREGLLLLPLEKDFDLDGANESKPYIETLGSFADNDVFKNEIKKIVHEQTRYIAEQSPNEQTSMIARGTINGAILLLERANAAKEFLEYQRTQDKG
jgi:hypothetical protein